MKNIPVYREPFSYARDNDQIDAYRNSRKAAIACKDAIQKAITANYNGWSLDSTTALEQLLGQFSMEQICYVLAITVRFKDWDGRISKQNKQWARTVPVYPDYDSLMNYDQNVRFVVDGVHPGLVDLLINKVRSYASNHKNK